MPDEYIVPISIDISGIIEKSQTIKTSLTEVGDSAKKVGKDAKDAFENAAKYAGDLNAKLVENSGKYGMISQNVNQLKRTLETFQTTAKTSLNPDVIIAYNKKIEDLKNQIKQMSNAGKAGFDDFGNAIVKVEEKTKKTTNAFGGAFQKLREIAYILPGVGVAGLIGFFTGPIIEYISKLDFVQHALDNLTVKQKDYAEAFKDTDYKKAISSISELTENISLAKQGFLDKTKVLNQYNKELGASIGYADNLDQAEQNIVKHGDAFIQVTLLKAAAQIALSDAAKKAVESAQLQNKSVTDFISFKSEALQTLNLITQGRFTKDVQSAQKADKDKQIKDLKDQAKEQLKIFDDFQKKAADLAKKNGIDFFDGTQDDKKGKVKDNSDAILAKRKSLLDQLVKLQNDFNSAEIAAIEDGETKEIAQNDVNYQNKVRTLKQQQDDLIAQAKANKFPELSKLFQDNIRELSLLIAKTEEEGQAADLAILAKHAALKLKAQQDSIRAIGILLKEETSARIEAVKANYDKVIIEARKNGVLTDELEKKLAKQREDDISDIQSKAIDKRLVEVQELEEAAINSKNRKSGENQLAFEERIQRELLAIDLKGTEARIEALSAITLGGGTLTPDQTKLLAQLNKQRNALQGKTDNNAEADRLNIFRAVGIDDNTQINIQKYSAAASTIGKITSDLFGSLASAADNQVNAIQRQIDALDQLLQADQAAVDKQQALSDKGRANSLDAAKKKLADDQKLKNALQKQEESAAKKRDTLQKASLIADSIAQVSNLITAATEIFKSVSVIPIIGPALAFATVGAMFATFAAAKVIAFNSVNTQTAEEGGVAGGDRHSKGGNKYVSMDGKDKNILEIERGERIFSRKNSEKHRTLFEAIQNNDYSKLDINDISIQDLLHGTGVMQQLEVAKRTGNQNITLHERANIVVASGNSEKYLKSIDGKMDNLNKKDPLIIDMGDYVWIDYGNGRTEKRYK